MVKYNVIQIFKTFSSDELNQFENFILNPFHNMNSKIIKLFSILRPFHPEYTDEKLSKENLFRSISGNASYKESYIRNLFSDLNVLAENFLKIKLTSDNPKFEKLFIEYLKDRDLFEITERKIKAFEKNVKSKKGKDHGYYEDINFIYEIKSFLIVDKALTDSFRDLQLNNTIKLFLLTIMEDAFYMIIEEQRVNVKHRLDFLKHNLEYIKKHQLEFEDSPLLMIYFNLCMCFLNNDNAEFFGKANEFFRKHFSTLTKIDKKNIYSVMQIFYINKISAGDNSFNKDYLNFMLDMLKFNVLSHKEKDFINLNLYRNILILCTIEKKTGILKEFISKYIEFIEAGSRETVLAYSNSHLNFLQGNFQKALEQCNNIIFKDLLNTTNDNLYFKNDIKILTLKSLYELDALENAISFIDTYKHFLRKTKLIKKEMRDSYLTFINFTNDLIRIKNKFDEYEIEKLESKLKNTKFSSASWISEKINELRSIHSKKLK